MSGIDAALAGNPRARAHHLAEIVVRFRDADRARLLIVVAATLSTTAFPSETTCSTVLWARVCRVGRAIGESIVIITRTVDLSIARCLPLGYAVGRATCTTRA